MRDETEITPRCAEYWRISQSYWNACRVHAYHEIEQFRAERLAHLKTCPTCRAHMIEMRRLAETANMPDFEEQS